jgi:hypothetical protein
VRHFVRKHFFCWLWSALKLNYQFFRKIIKSYTLNLYAKDAETLILYDLPEIFVTHCDKLLEIGKNETEKSIRFSF